jgi:hypothetical protein
MRQKWYPGDAKTLAVAINGLLGKDLTREVIKALIVKDGVMKEKEMASSAGGKKTTAKVDRDGEIAALAKYVKNATDGWIGKDKIRGALTRPSVRRR